MVFAPKYWHDGNQVRTAFIVGEKRINIDVLILDGLGSLVIKSIPKTEMRGMRDVDFGKPQERKMKSTLRRLAKKKGTAKRVRMAVKEVVS